MSESFRGAGIPAVALPYTLMAVSILGGLFLGVPMIVA